MLYEHILNIERDRAIELSECYENSTESVEAMEHYLLKFNEMLDILRETKTPSVKKQPLFEWNDRNSSSWIFEQYRIKHTLHKMLMQEAKKHFDGVVFSGGIGGVRPIKLNKIIFLNIMGYYSFMKWRSSIFLCCGALVTVCI